MNRPIILCVDDEPIVLESLKEQFRRQFEGRYQIEVAEDSAEALELVAELKRDGKELPVIVSDHIMPGMKGDALLIEVHARLPPHAEDPSYRTGRRRGRGPGGQPRRALPLHRQALGP